MTDNQDKLNLLISKLNVLLKKQEVFSREISNLQTEINQLKSAVAHEAPTVKANLYQPTVTEPKVQMREKRSIAPLYINDKKDVLQSRASFFQSQFELKSNLEKFIGENLINKIGIIITIIGVAIGAKYSIDHNLIAPVTRIILAYLAGFVLLGLGMKLKNKYENYSAVLVSGAMTIMYFITFLAYSLYGLMHQSFAFVSMVVLTVFTVGAAIKYKQQVIAHIGLVGAYAVPFLLSEGQGNELVLFSYMAIINIGILFIAIKKYWKPLYYSSFGFSWLIYLLWLADTYDVNVHFVRGLVYLSLFFIIFYQMFLIYKLRYKEKFEIVDVVLILLNSFVFYGIGYALLESHEIGGKLLGVFTLANALLHFIVSSIVYKLKLADKNLFYLIFGLVLVFVTISIPVQLDGNWVTMLWVGEASLLFWLGRTKGVPFYEKLSYILMILSFYSIGHDWLSISSQLNRGQSVTSVMPIINIHFFSSILFVGAFGFINYLSSIKKYTAAFLDRKEVLQIITFTVPAVFIVSLYLTFRIEILNYWNQLYWEAKSIAGSGTYAVYKFKGAKIMWLLNYSLLFVSLLSIVNLKKFKDEKLGLVSFGLSVLTIFIFLTQGLYVLSEIRDLYLVDGSGDMAFVIGMRYVSLLFAGFTLWTYYRLQFQNFINWNFKKYSDFLLHISAVWVLSNELIHWLTFASSAESYKLGLSILWGTYSLGLIVLGIWKRKTHLRIGAIILFGITLIKLFVYDISDLNTIAKTIVFISLGILLLTISFLYNKYKSDLFEKEEC